MEGQQIIKCPQCGSNKVQVMPLILSFFVMAGCLMWIPVLGWILAPIFFVIWLVMLIFFKSKIMRCQECKHSFKVDKSTYQEYKSHLNK